MNDAGLSIIVSISQISQFSKYSPWMCSINIPWELVRNANYPPPPRPTKIETQRKGLAMYNLTSPPSDSDTQV